MTDDFTCRCPLCGNHLILKTNSIDCVECGYSALKRSPVEDLPEVRKTGEPFNPPRRRPHPGVKN
jgi:hypothetical protein